MLILTFGDGSDSSGTFAACSFAVVIQSLPLELRDAVCIFYLVLRALDTVEDDMALSVATKLPILRSFHEKIYDRHAHMTFTAEHMQGYSICTMCCLQRNVSEFTGIQTIWQFNLKAKLKSADLTQVVEDELWLWGVCGPDEAVSSGH